MYYLVLHCVTLVTSVTFVLHVTCVTSVTCSTRKFHQRIYSNTPPEFSDLCRDFDKYKFLERVKKKSAQDLGSHISYLTIVCYPNQGMLIALNSFPHIMISPHHMTCSLGILETCTHASCTPVINEGLNWFLALLIICLGQLQILQELF